MEFLKVPGKVMDSLLDSDLDLLKVLEKATESDKDFLKVLEEALGMDSCLLETEDSIKVLEEATDSDTGLLEMEEDFIKVLEEEEEDSQVATADRRAASLALEVEGSQAVEAEAIPEDTSLEAGARAAMCPLRRG